jgi:hypothetical protein
MRNKISKALATGAATATLVAAMSGVASADPDTRTGSKKGAEGTFGNCLRAYPGGDCLELFDPSDWDLWPF